MALRNNVRYAQGAALAAALALSAAADTSGAGTQLAEARQLRAHGRYAEARDAADAAVSAAQKVQPDGPSVAVALDELGMDENNLGNYRGSEMAFNRALAIVHASPADDLATTSARVHLAELYLTERRPADADPLLRRAAAAMQSAARPDPIALAAAYDDLAVACIMQRKHREAETLLRQAQALIETELGPDHPMLAKSLVPLAALLLAERRYSEAVAPAERAWHMMQSAPDSAGEPDVAFVFNVLSVVYFRAGRTVEAESYGRQCITRAEALLGPRNPSLGLYLANYAAVLKQMGRKSEAKEIQQRAGAILAQSAHGNSSGLTVNVDAIR